MPHRNAPRKEHTPTRTCPHPWCLRMHLLVVATGVVAMGPLIWHSLTVLLIFAVVGLIACAVARVVYQRPMTDVAREEITGPRDKHGRPLTLVLNPRWARVAITYDVIVAAAVLVAITLVINNPGGEAEQLETSHTTVGSFLLSAALIGFHQYAHKKATDPVKPKRAPATAPLDA